MRGAVEDRARRGGSAVALRTSLADVGRTGAKRVGRALTSSGSAADVLPARPAAQLSLTALPAQAARARRRRRCEARDCGAASRAPPPAPGASSVEHAQVEPLGGALGRRQREQVGQHPLVPQRRGRVAHVLDRAVRRAGPGAHALEQVEEVGDVVGSAPGVAAPSPTQASICVAHERARRRRSAARGGRGAASANARVERVGQLLARAPAHARVVAAGDLAALAGVPQRQRALARAVREADRVGQRRRAAGGQRRAARPRGASARAATVRVVGDQLVVDAGDRARARRPTSTSGSPGRPPVLVVNGDARVAWPRPAPAASRGRR